MDFQAVVDELYGLPLKEFTAARKERAKAARAEGDPELSADIQALDKPTVAAWLTNQLVRVHRDEVDALLELGADLREVMADLSGDELRELTRQRHQLVFALVQQARSLGRSLGQPISEGVTSSVRETLEATLSDSSSADDVSSGHLSDALRVSGFGDGQAEVSPPRQSAPRRSRKRSEGPDATVTDLGAKRQERDARERRQETQRAVDTAREGVERAQGVAERTMSRLRTARDQLETSTKAVERLREALDKAVNELDDAEQGVKAIEDENAAAETNLADAQQVLSEKEASLDSLGS